MWFPNQHRRRTHRLPRLPIRKISWFLRKQHRTKNAFISKSTPAWQRCKSGVLCNRNATGAFCLRFGIYIVRMHCNIQTNQKKAIKNEKIPFKMYPPLNDRGSRYTFCKRTLCRSEIMKKVITIQRILNRAKRG